MIKPRQFTVLAGVTLVAVLLAAVLYASANRFSPGRIEGQPLVPELLRSVNSVAAIEVTQGDKKLTVERAGEQWKIKERAGYPANAEKARTLVLQLSNAQLIDPKTANKDRYQSARAGGPDGQGRQVAQVRILDDKGKPLADVILGKSRNGRVRLRPRRLLRAAVRRRPDLARQRRAESRRRGARLGPDRHLQHRHQQNLAPDDRASRRSAARDRERHRREREVQAGADPRGQEAQAGRDRRSDPAGVLVDRSGGRAQARRDAHGRQGERADAGSPRAVPRSPSACARRTAARGCR